MKNNIKFIEANSIKIIYNGDVAVQSVLRDISEKKKAERKLLQLSSHLSTLLDNLNTGILMEQSDRIIVHTNKKFCDLFGNVFTPEDMLGKNCGEKLLSTQYFFKHPEHFVESTNALVKENKRSINEEIELKDGRSLERDFIPIIYGGVQYGTVWQYRDITNRINTEKKLLRALESERSYNELNKNFVSMVSHEFRTPLTSIHSAAELLLEFSDRFGPEDIKKRVHRIHSSSLRMEKLIDDVLTIGKLDATTGVENAKEFTLSEILDEILTLVNSSEFKGRVFRVNGLKNESMMVGDSTLIELIFRNLLENACKYSDEIVDINFKFYKKSVHIKIRDYGLGIPKEELKLIFEPFKRASNTGGIKGTGLGLPIVKKAVLKLGGKIRVNSKSGEGSVFSVNLPLNSTAI